MGGMYVHVHTVKPLLMDTPYKGHNRKRTSIIIKDRFNELHILTIHFKPLKRGQPLTNYMKAWSQGILNYKEV